MGSATYFQSYRFGKRTVVCRRLIFFREKDGEIARLSVFVPKSLMSIFSIIKAMVPVERVCHKKCVFNWLEFYVVCFFILCVHPAK